MRTIGRADNRMFYVVVEGDGTDEVDHGGRRGVAAPGVRGPAPPVRRHPGDVRIAADGTQRRYGGPDVAPWGEHER
ncbi:hypothetical protein ACWDA7_26605 [Streptomyces sp. NPDC001156]